MTSLIIIVHGVGDIPLVQLIMGTPPILCCYILLLDPVPLTNPLLKPYN